MILTVLGSGTFQPSMQRGCSGYLIEIKKKNILFDCGPGVLRQLAIVGKHAKDIDFIFFSHLHPDHICDLIPVLFAKKHSGKEEHKKIRLYGPPGFKTFLLSWIVPFAKWLEGYPQFCEIGEYNESQIQTDDWIFTCLPVLHSDDSYGLKVTEDNDISLAYSGDADYCGSLVELCTNTHTAILECSFSDKNKVKGHLSPADIKRIARESNCRNIILSHIFPETDTPDLIEEFSDLTGTNVNIAKELETITISV
ncbi:MBL fold metallo-hydrolase [candidate division KSB1 bacterium]